MKRVLIGTKNPGKAREIISILQNAGASEPDFVTPQDIGIEDSPVEAGIDYETNAIIKARFYGKKSGIPTIADDSGLEVYALGGFPGIKSARVETPENTDKSRYETLLGLMSEVKPENRGARFVCVAVAFFPTDTEIVKVRAEWEGLILENPEGESGFGYDPVFYDPVEKKTAATMAVEEKNRISHRGKAFRSLHELIKKRYGE